ncbi:hypothetical protein BCV72DRAFT_328196 [Rhizopus microsporus var. microsporus]|uniref:BTB domain-containing protein n=2 Tax=Rhizopus microsporus TaxID=58291 RepID=A0A2G4T3V8_RHIZD|nr:uncharacterized protein RHIMIDRAFT_311639 [Rhizopus microsporus ATCC 52813]ORE06683.1 hypothetical protein BCV72DRAFT_328196 [Rhizopus microsporus var. microsporus]PHZ15694.1 hypothetical protein RHIMIDRAFT_311639 [Rhizopus microsporus ATCC 52813]
MCVSQVKKATIIRINVGGRSFVTYDDTLKRSLFFKYLLENVMQNSGKTVNGEYFVDRSGELFAHVLDYLVHGTLHWKQLDRRILAQLWHEADFYQIKGMKNAIEEEIASLGHNVDNLSLVPFDKIKHTINCHDKDESHIKNVSSKYDLITVIDCAEKVWECAANVTDHDSPCTCVVSNMETRNGRWITVGKPYALVSTRE